MVRVWAASAVTGFRGRRPRLGEVLDDRTNNFDLIRLCAAALVIYGHSFFEAPADTTPDLVQRSLGDAEYAGSVAVYAFFLISGLLITGSMEKHRSALAFVTLRVARIWPGFAVCAGLLLFAVVPLASGIAPWDLAWRRAAAACFGTDALFFVRDVCGSLPGAFPRTPVPNAFGFSWWTLPAEVHCYAMVLGLGLLLRSRFSGTGREVARFGLATLALLAGYLAATAHPPGDAARFHAEFTVMGGYSSYPVLFFFAGMLLYAPGPRRRSSPPRRCSSRSRTRCSIRPSPTASWRSPRRVRCGASGCATTCPTGSTSTVPPCSKWSAPSCRAAAPPPTPR